MWEYISVTAVEIDELMVKANKLGKEGWEAVGFTSMRAGLGWGQHIMVLKREIKDSKEAKKH